MVNISLHPEIVVIMVVFQVLRALSSMLWCSASQNIKCFTMAMWSVVHASQHSVPHSVPHECPSYYYSVFPIIFLYMLVLLRSSCFSICWRCCADCKSRWSTYSYYEVCSNMHRARDCVSCEGEATRNIPYAITTKNTFMVSKTTTAVANNVDVK